MTASESPEFAGASPTHQVPWRLETAVLEREVVGANLRGRLLRDELQPGPTLLVFLRHLG
jgi:hypothetical protein